MTPNADCDEDVNDTVIFNDDCDDDDEEDASVRLTLSGHGNLPEEKASRPSRRWQRMNM